MSDRTEVLDSDAAEVRHVVLIGFRACRQGIQDTQFDGNVHRDALFEQIYCDTFIYLFIVGFKSTQPGHPSVCRRNEYRPKGGDALRLESKSRWLVFGDR